MKIPLAKPVLNDKMIDAAIDALQNERFVLGESVFKFEEEFARYCGVKYGISTNSGTDALQLSLIALGIGEGNEVITTPWTFIATSNVVLLVGATLVFADVNLSTYTIDPNEIMKALSEKTRAIIPVHIYGYPAEMDAIMEIAEERGLKVIEDACQAHGAIYNGRKVGAIGHVGCFSFYPSKNMTVCGDGGMVVTNDEEIAERIAKLRNCGRRTKYEHDMIGYTARLNTVNAAIGLVQLKYLDEWNERRRKHAEEYRKFLKHLEDIVLPPEGNDKIKPVYHLFVIRVKDPRDRDPLMEWLKANGVECGVHYPIPVHLQPIYRELFGFKEGSYEISEMLAKTVLSLPMFPELTDDQIHFVCEKVEEYFEKKLKR